MKHKMPGQILFLTFLLFTSNIFSQNALTDTSRLQKAVQHTIDFYIEEIGGDSHLFNGPGHRGYMRPAISHPYYLSEDIQTGTLWFDGIFYKNVPLMYDITGDHLITLQYVKDSSYQYRSIFKMDLPREKTGGFTLGSREFIKLEPDTNTTRMKPGFYELMHNGKVKLIVRRSKVYAEQIRDRDLERRYDSTSTYYLLKDGIFHHITSKKVLLGVLKDKRSALAAYIKKNKWKFRKQREVMIPEVAHYYEQLTN